LKRALSVLLLVILAAVSIWYSLSPKYPVAQGLDLKGGMRVVLEPDDTKDDGKKVAPDTMKIVRDVLESRVNSFGLSGTEVRLKGDRQVVILLPGVKDPQKALDSISQTAQLEFRHLNNVSTDRNPNARYKMTHTPGNPARNEPDKYSFTDSSTNKPADEKEVVAQAPLILKGNYLKATSEAQINPTNGQPQVTFEFNSEGAQRFATFTSENTGEVLAVVLDDKIISAPNINEPITEGRGQISGGFATMAEARVLANLLNSGALPVPLRPAETQFVGATLGQESIDKSIHAGAIGLGLVLVFMLAYYWLPGFLACIALVLYSAITFSLFKGAGIFPPIVLDLPGITGFILSVGMAVDANILIFERLKEELRAGKSVHAAVDAGFNRAFSSILDSNVTTWIVCAILIWLGAPIIKGFAITLAIGVAVSMFTAITVTRTLLHLVMSIPAARNEQLFALNVSWASLFFPATRRGAVLHVFERRRLNFGFSIVLAVFALVFLAMTPAGMGLKPGIDFTGGTVFEAAFNQPVTREQVLAALPQGVEATVSIARSEQPGTKVTVTAQGVSEADKSVIQERLGNQEILRGFDPTTYKATEVEGAPAAAPASPAANAPAVNAPGANAPAANAPAAGNQPATPAAKPAPGGKSFQATAVYFSPITEADVRRALDTKADPSEVNLSLKNLSVNVEAISHAGDNAISTALITSKSLNPTLVQEVRTNLQKVGGGLIEPMSQVSSIGPSVAQEVTLNAFASVFVASLAIVLYLAFRFAIGGFINGLKFGAGAVIALFHDVVITVGLFALMGAVAGWHVDSLFVTACLTILGFSVHDTIVVYDRIRENLHHRLRGETFADVSNRSITQTFDRSINTSFTVLLVVAALVLFGGESIRLFNVALLFGIALGTYSSIFVASPLVVLMERNSDRPSTSGPAPTARVAPRGDDQPLRRRETATAAPSPRPTVRPAARPVVAPEATEAGDDVADETDDAGAGRSRPGQVRPRRKRRL